jgi:hypothetical protein
MIPESETESDTTRAVRELQEELWEEANEDWNESRTMKTFRYMLWIAEIISTAVVSWQTWNQGTDNWNCARLRYWVIIFSSRLFFLIPLRHISRQMQERGEGVHPRVKKLEIWLKYFTFFWFIIGQSWLYYGSCNQSRVLWVYSLILIIVIYISLGKSVMLLLMFLICSPLICLLRRFLRETRTASRKSLRGLETKRFKLGDLDAESSDGPTCVICLIEYEDGDEIKVLPCGHEYHGECVDEWLGKHNRTCPTCRHDITLQVEEALQFEAKST